MGPRLFYSLPLMLVMVAHALGKGPPTPANSKREAIVPRFAATAAKAASRGGGSSNEGESSATRAGNEWWVKDPPWFLPPPPEWGPMPPTMYTSFFHKPRYPALSTANYYPLFSRTDEYDAHLPASMSRRAAYTQQQIYDHYVATYRDHTREMGPVAGDPNSGVSNPTLYADGVGLDSAGLSYAHGRALSLQHPNNYIPAFARGGGMSSGRMGNPMFTGAFPGGMPAVSFMETSSASASALRHDSTSLRDGRSVTYFASLPTPTFTSSPLTDTDTDTDDVETATEEELDSYDE